MNLQTLALASLALLVEAGTVEKAGNCGCDSSSSSDNGPGYRFQHVEAHADMGFYAFSFGASHTYAYQDFQIKVRKPAWLSVTDCYCPGDIFQVFDNGKPVLVTSDCPQDTPSCEFAFNDNAWGCLFDDNFCKGVILLDTGHHNLTIATINSSVGGGAAFLRIDSICPNAPGSALNPMAPPPACCMINPYPDLDDYEATPGRLCNQMVQYPGM